MFVHVVLFTLKADLSEDDRAEFMKGVNLLTETGHTEAVYIGTPADTHRPVVKRDYDVCATVIMKDLAAHDAYQVHPKHLEFLENYQKYWEGVVIYDAD